MSLLLGWVAVYFLDLHWGWYAACVFAYLAEWHIHYEHRQHILRRVDELEDRLTRQD